MSLKEELNLKNVNYEKKGHIAYVTLNRPEKLNSLQHDMMREMLRCWKDFGADNDMWVAVLSGEGRAFCAGHDFTSGEGREEEPPFLHYGAIEVYKPIIVAVQGYALGFGCYMAFSSDALICSEDAQMGWSQVKRGLGTIGGTVLLPRLLPGLARWHLLSGELLSAQEAYRLGLAVKVVPKEKLMDEATKLAEKICEGSPTAVRYMKEAIERCKLLSIGEALRVSKLISTEMEGTEDYKEAVAAFNEKRKPVFKNR